MAWRLRRRYRGRHCAGSDACHPGQVMEQVIQDFRETVRRRAEVDKLAYLVRREFGS